MTVVLVVVDQPVLEVVDRAVTPVDLGGGGEAAYPGDQHVLVVAPVEDADHAGLGCVRSIAPEEVVPLLVPRGGLERRQADPLRVQQPGAVLDDPTLAGGVHPLENEQNAPLPVDLRLCVEPLLQLGQRIRKLAERSLALLLTALEPGSRPAVVLSEIDGTGTNPQSGRTGVVAWRHCGPSGEPSRRAPGRRGRRWQDRTVRSLLTDPASDVTDDDLVELYALPGRPDTSLGASDLRQLGRRLRPGPGRSVPPRSRARATVGCSGYNARSAMSCWSGPAPHGSRATARSSHPRSTSRCGAVSVSRRRRRSRSSPLAGHRRRPARARPSGDHRHHDP